MGGNKNKNDSTLTYTHDGTNPIVNITSYDISNDSITNKTNITFFFDISEPINGFTKDDIICKNCSIDGDLTIYDADNNVYTASVIPIYNGTCSIYIAGGSFTDKSAGNPNNMSNVLTWTFDGTPPNITINPSSLQNIENKTTNDQSIDFTFESTEITNDFTVNDVSCVNGVISYLSTQDKKTYTGTFKTSFEGYCSIFIPNDSFKDRAGNFLKQLIKTHVMFRYHLVHLQIMPVIQILLQIIHGYTIMVNHLFKLLLLILMQLIIPLV